MATGDRFDVAKRVGDRLGIDNINAELTPFEKGELIDSIKASGKVVVMVGDGINDTLALSKADISIAMGGGADVALNVSDIVILNSSLKSIRYTLHLIILRKETIFKGLIKGKKILRP